MASANPVSTRSRAGVVFGAPAMKYSSSASVPCRLNTSLNN